MGLSVSFTVDGLEDILNKLSGSSEKVKEFINSEPGNIADKMVTDMQAICPVDTGYMRDHIMADDMGGSATVTSEADYSIYVELGTRFMAAQPFFFPVVDKFTIQDVLNDFQSEVGLG